jgi:hypothetical protein
MQGELDIRIPMDAGIAGWVATHGKLLNIPDAYDVLQFARACLAFSLERHSAPVCIVGPGCPIQQGCGRVHWVPYQVCSVHAVHRHRWYSCGRHSADQQGDGTL